MTGIDIALIVAAAIAADWLLDPAVRRGVRARLRLRRLVKRRAFLPATIAAVERRWADQDPPPPPRQDRWL